MPPAAAAAAAAEDDQLDRLPDPLVLLVLNLIGDVKTLGRCSAVSPRLRSLVPLVDSVLVRIDCVLSDSSPASSSAIPDKPRSLLSLLSRFLSTLLPRKPSPSPPDVSHHSPTQVLKNFRSIKHLRIQLPAGELGVDDAVLLKWNASFGSSLDHCVILGAAEDDAADTPLPDAFYTNGSLKLRVVWTISSLIAASARHYLLQPIVADHHATLETLELTDADGQGVLVMDGRQVREMRERGAAASGASSQRTLVPALSMRLWYAPEIEVGGGKVLKGATLVAIRPSEGEGGRGRDAAAEACWIRDAFEEPYQTAAVMLLKKRNYCLEMNSF